MNLNAFEAEQLLNELASSKKQIPGNVQLGVAPPSVHLHAALNILNEGKIWVGSQNVHHETSGAFTGEISANMVSSLACDFTLIGHSERREYFHETDEQLLQKVRLALDEELKVVFCCGEPLGIRKSGEAVNYVLGQLERVLFQFTEKDFENILIAYEPIWAIGTGETASAEQAQEIHGEIRGFLKSKYSKDVADEIPILYGGSCKPSNAQELFAQPDIDGGLIGGASLKSADFLALANSF
jgi:triosephosphate isomerase